jgi:hypothetical protein
MQKIGYWQSLDFDYDIICKRNYLLCRLWHTTTQICGEVAKGAKALVLGAHSVQTRKDSEEVVSSRVVVDNKLRCRIHISLLCSEREVVVSATKARLLDLRLRNNKS